MNSNIRILIVDDHALVRGAVRERLSRETDMSVVGTAGTADEAIEKTMDSKPDVVLMDIDMPGLIPFDAARRIVDFQLGARIIFLSAFCHDRYIEQALQAKASGYITKREPPEVVVTAIREVAAGGAFFSEEVRSRIVIDSGSIKLAERSKTRVSTLTPREHEILQYIARGLAKKEIAATMDLSVKTIDRHAANLMAKLGIHDRVELTRFAIREGMARP